VAALFTGRVGRSQRCTELSQEGEKQGGYPTASYVDCNNRGMRCFLIEVLLCFCLRVCWSIKLFDVQHAEHEGRSLVVARNGRQLHIYDANDFLTRKGWLGRGIRALASFEAFNSKRCDIIRLAVANGITHVVCFTNQVWKLALVDCF